MDEIAFSNYFQDGLDTVSIPALSIKDAKKETIQNTGEVKIVNNNDLTTSPLMINIIAKEREGLKRRDGLLPFPNSSIKNIVGMRVDPRSQDSFVIFKKDNGSYVLARIFKDNGTIIESAEFTLPNNPDEIRFKVVTRFPSTTNNVFIFGVDKSKNIYNLATTFVNGAFTAVIPNNVLSSSRVSGILDVVDSEETGNRLFLLIKNGNEYNVIFGSTTSLNDYYIIPSSVIPTAIFSLDNSLFVGCENEILRVDFKDNFSTSSPLFRFANNVGIKDAYSYQIVTTFLYAYSLSAFFSMDLTSKARLNVENTITEFIDLKISNMSPNLSPNYCFYNATEKMIGWICKIDSEFIYKSLHLFANGIQTYNKDWTNFYKENADKYKFILYYSIDKKAWFLNYYDKELISHQNYFIKTYGKYCESMLCSKDSIYIAHRDFYFDDDVDFPVLFMPRIKNEQILSGGVARARRVAVSYTTTDDASVLADGRDVSICCGVSLNKNIIREKTDSIRSDDNTKFPMEKYGIDTLSYHLNESEVSPNCLIIISSKCVETIIGVLVIEEIAGRKSS